MSLFGIYIHWPFCLSKCPYCDFYSRAEASVDEDAFLKAYQRDIDRLPTNQSVTSIFFGGGTPSLMSPRLVENILSSIHQRLPVASDVEISLEANPDAIDLPKMKDFKRIGVNRLSMGVQALNEADLKFLGRRHSLKTALTQLGHARSVFDNLSMDLMYARPNQTPKAWAVELTQALSFDLPHYSLYQLTIEEGTPFYRRQVEQTDEETARTLFLQTMDQMASNGTPLYEVSNFAKPDFECRHNMTYWLGDDYAGVGPAAHGRLGLTATENPKSVEEWLSGAHAQTQLTSAERFEEKIIMGMRLAHGMPKAGISSQAIHKAKSNGWIIETPTHIRPTSEGLLMLNQAILLLTDGR